MKNFVNSIATRVLRTNSTATALHQTDRNALRSDSLTALANTLTAMEIPNTMVKEGIAIELPHDELGAVVIVLSETVKDLNYDIATEGEEYAREVAEKAEAKLQKEAETAKKKAETEANKAKVKAKATK